MNDYAVEYRLNVRQGVTRKEGTPLTTEDVAFNITQWSDSTAEGNLIPGRFAAFVDEATGGGFQIVGNHVCHWYARDSGQAAHFQMLFWGIAPTILLAQT